MSILGIRRELQVVLAHIAPAIPSEIVTVITINRHYRFLLTIGIVCTKVSMNMQIFETVNLVVCLNITHKRTCIRTVVLMCQCCCRVTCCLCIFRIRPRSIVISGWGNYALVVAIKPIIENALGCQHISICIYGLTFNRHGRIHRKSRTDNAGWILVVNIHSLGVDIEQQVVIQERRAEVHSSGDTLHL